MNPMQKLIVITPTSRPENLLPIYKAFQDSESIWLPIDWHIVFDAAVDQQNIDTYTELLKAHNGRIMQIHFHASDKANAVAGHYHRNFVLNRLHEKAKYNVSVMHSDWVYQLDDDNVLHPELLRFLKNEYDLLKATRVIMFDQVFKNGSTRLKVDRSNIKIGFVDTAMMICRLSAIGKTRYDIEDYCADGKFISEVYQANKELTIFYNQPLCYYNYLRP
jgi:hypothetical protein